MQNRNRSTASTWCFRIVVFLYCSTEWLPKRYVTKKPQNAQDFCSITQRSLISSPHQSLDTEVSINSGLWLLTDMPNCCRAMRMTSVVLSALLTTSVLAWWKHFGKHCGNMQLFVWYIIYSPARDVIKYPNRCFCTDRSNKNSWGKKGNLHMHNFQYPLQRFSEEWSEGHPSLSPHLCNCV